MKEKEVLHKGIKISVYQPSTHFWYGRWYADWDMENHRGEPGLGYSISQKYQAEVIKIAKAGIDAKLLEKAGSNDQV
jgi:hypothetical protein